MTLKRKLRHTNIEIYSPTRFDHMLYLLVNPFFSILRFAMQLPSLISNMP